MMTEKVSNVKRALERLTVFDVWGEAPYSECPYPLKDGVYVNPFKESVNRTPSLSVSKGGKRWKDFSDNLPAGGVVAWVERCHPDWEKLDVLRWIVEKAGLEWHESLTSGERPSRKEWLADQREKRLREKREREEARDAAAAAREQALEWPEAAVPLSGAPEVVVERWIKGRSRVDGNALCVRLAEKRGWPVQWVLELFAQGELSCPLLPWSGAEKGARGVAFPVRDVLEDTSGRWSLRTLAGYHQVYPRHGSWIFVPHVPKEPKTDFQRALAAEGRPVPAVPFVLGDPETARAAIVTEGQWDAITVWGVLDGFAGAAEDVMVFGIRGVNGVDAWLAHWGCWLRERRPWIWLLPDNDDRGRPWYDPEASATGVTLEERLWHADLTVARSLTPKHAGKDFNDYYVTLCKNGLEPDAGWLRERMRRLGYDG